MAVSGEGRAVDVATLYTLDFVLAALPGGASRILEIGCGDGALATALGTAGFEVVALDADAEAVERARALGVDARIGKWPDFSAGWFDAVLFTRSLHHVDDLPASVEAAFAALDTGGRIIVEDFMAEGGSERSSRWFHSFVLLLDRAGLVAEPTPFLSEILGRTEAHASHLHELHASAAIERALRASAETVRATHAAYYFRYLLPALAADSALRAALLDHEQQLIDAGAIDALGRRYVAESRSR